jgi:RimJ/RimL family protein N-acetyltransferase
MKLYTERLWLDELALTDLNDIHALHSCPEVDEFNTLGIPESLRQTEMLLEEWLERQAAVPRMSYVFCVRTIDSEQFIGLMALNLGKPNYRNAEVWYKTHPVHWGRGYTTEALKHLIQFGFEELNLHRIEAGCAVANIASIKVLEKAGMTREGRKRQILPIRGQWVDNYFYSILDSDRAFSS